MLEGLPKDSLFMKDTQDENLTPPPDGNYKTSGASGEPVAATKAQVDFIHKMMVGIVVVLFLAFFGFLISLGGAIVTKQSERKATYEDLRNKVFEQNYRIEKQSERIDGLTQELRLNRFVK